MRQISPHLRLQHQTWCIPLGMMKISLWNIVRILPSGCCFENLWALGGHGSGDQVLIKQMDPFAPSGFPYFVQSYPC